MIYTHPAQGRFEIPLADKASVTTAATALRELADKLDEIAGRPTTEDEITFLAWGAIKSSSHILKGAK